MTKLFNRLIFFPMLALYCAITTDPNIILSSKANYRRWIIFIAQTKKKILNLWWKMNSLQFMVNIITRYITTPLLAFWCVIVANPDHILSSKDQYKKWALNIAKIKKVFWRF